MHHAGRWKRETEIWLNESTTKDLLIGRYKGTERQEHLEWQASIFLHWKGKKGYS